MNEVQQVLNNNYVETLILHATTAGIIKAAESLKKVDKYKPSLTKI